ncbi:capsular biosynthesis protein [Mariprofundus sp. EBB-1]|uniref:tyrosine-protein phosphatase n=1 Tax=Mariprofundus sp. EBB-1 TaxID=2650971 RepID=UPI000EF1D10F|nr:CpsB/CapC family capsule biosynthesis tyrosine phosphatase [Mariprofundus sp. EBB-1]RLL55894.1 capsular biosynthesis protein [Mariprofundus sp. EBB-1]
MFDIHCHLLPGIDDGASTLEQSLALARIAVADGITHLVCTPHIQPGTYNNNLNTISSAFSLFSYALVEHEIPLHVAMAAEVRICPEILPMIASGNIPMFKAPTGEMTMLLEFPHSHIPPGSDKMVRWLREQGIGVLIAHPERNKEMMRNVDKLLPFINMGCKLQLTAASLVGRFGDLSKIVAIELLKRGWVSLLATDAHNTNRRPPVMHEGRSVCESIVGVELANMLVNEGPWSLVGGMFAPR